MSDTLHMGYGNGLRVGSRQGSSQSPQTGIRFADAVAVFSDEAALLIADTFTDEERFILLGSDAFGRLLVVVYTWRGEQRIRIISARKATRQERRQYER